MSLNLNFLVVYFDRDAEGDLKPTETREAINAEAAEQAARGLAVEHAGAVVVARVVDSVTGQTQRAFELARCGEVDLTALRA